jgi:hypothetical protein
MKKNKYIISYSIQLVLTLAVLGAVIWYAQIMPINTPLVSAFNFDLAQFGIIIGLVIICLVYIFILVGFLVAAIRQKQKGSDHYLVSSARIILPIVFVFIAPFVFTLSFLTTESDKTLASPLTITAVCDELKKQEPSALGEEEGLNDNGIDLPNHISDVVLEQNCFGRLGNVLVEYTPDNMKDSSISFYCYYAKSNVGFVQNKICDRSDDDFTLSNQEKIGAYMLYYGQPEGEDDNVMAYHLVLQSKNDTYIYATCQIQQGKNYKIQYSKENFVADATAVIDAWNKL